MAEEYSQLKHRLPDIIDSVYDFEEALMNNREYIVKNLNVMSLLMNPCSFKDVISEDEQGNITTCYDSRMTEKAAHLFIDAILRSKDETKWSVFKDALKRSEGNELIKDILCKGVTAELFTHQVHQAQINLQRGCIAEQWQTELVCEGLRQEQVLTTQEREEVLATLQTKGSSSANHLILTMVPRRKGFLPKMLKILWLHGYKKSVKELDFDFFRKMEAASQGRSYSKNVDTSNDEDDYANETVAGDCNDDKTCADAIGVNYLEHHSLPTDVGAMSFNISADLPNDSMKMINTVNMMNYSTTNNLNQTDDDPIASRTRSKTKLLPSKDPHDTVLKEPTLEHGQALTSHRQTGTSQRQTETPYKPRETSPVEQAAVQRTRSDLFDASIKSELGKDAAKKVSLKEIKKQTVHEVNFIVCICGKRFISHEELKTHQSTDCKASLGLSTEKQRPLLAGRDGRNAPRARFKTELPKTTNPDETCLWQPVEEYTQAGASYKPTETSPGEQAVFQRPRSDSFDGSKKYVRGKDTTTDVTLQQVTKQTNYDLLVCVCEKRFDSKDELRKHQSKDCQVKQVNYPVNQFELDRGEALRASLQEDKQTIPKVKLVACVCEKRYISEDSLREHQIKDCKVKRSHYPHNKCAVGEKAAMRVNLEEKKVAKDKVNPVSCLCEKRFISEDALRKHQNTDCKLAHYADKKCTAGKKEAKTVILQVAKKQTKQIKKLMACPCGKRFISEDTLRSHQNTDCRVFVGPDKNPPLPSQNQNVTFRASFDPLKQETGGNENDTLRYFNRMEARDFNTAPQTNRSENIHPVDRDQATASKPKFNRNNEIAKGNHNKCTCGTQFISQEALQRHIRFVCKARSNETSSEDTIIKSFCNEQYPMAKTKSNQQDIPRDHSTRNNIKSSECEIPRKQGGFKTSSQVAQQENAQALEISREETLRATYSHNPENSVKKESSIHNSEPTTSLREHNYRKYSIQCVCGRKCMSEDHLNNHRESCTEFIQLSNQTDEDEVSLDTRKPCIDSGLLELEQNMVTYKDTLGFVCYCGEFFASRELFAIHRTRKQCARKLQNQERETCLLLPGDQDMTSKTPLKPMTSSLNSDHRSRKEETAQGIKTEGPDCLKLFNGTVPNTSLQDTSEHNGRSNSQISNTEVQERRPNNRSNSHISNTEVQERRPNNRDTHPTRESASGFGFQSTRTLQLNKRQ